MPTDRAPENGSKTGSILLDAAALHHRLAREGAGGATLRVLELRWSPSGPPALERYQAGHIPGALFVDLERDLSHAQPRGPGGRHPMVSASEFAALLARLGISEGTCAVIYDDGSGAIAARLWFQLRLHGHQRAQLLDGGLAAWTAAGYPLDSAAPQPSPAPARPLVRDESLLADRATIAAWVAQRGSSAAAPLLLDARAPERYRGEVEPIDPVAGHIPGAINLPFARLLRGPADPRWRPAEEVRALLLQHTGASEESLRARGVIASCGSGVTACHLLAALALAGLPPGKLYGGSYSDWVSEANAEVARGSEPG